MAKLSITLLCATFLLANQEQRLFGTQCALNKTTSPNPPGKQHHRSQATSLSVSGSTSSASSCAAGSPTTTGNSINLSGSKTITISAEVAEAFLLELASNYSAELKKITEEDILAQKQLEKEGENSCGTSRSRSSSQAKRGSCKAIPLAPGLGLFVVKDDKELSIRSPIPGKDPSEWLLLLPLDGHHKPINQLVRLSDTTFASSDWGNFVKKWEVQIKGNTIMGRCLETRNPHAL